MEDGPAGSICIQSLTLDDLYSHLHFARSVGLNNEQTRAFVEIMQQLKAQMAAPAATATAAAAATADGDNSSSSMEQTFLTFKQAVMSNAAVVRKQPPTQAASGAGAGPMSSLALSGSRPTSATKTTPITSARSGAAGSSAAQAGPAAATPAAASRSSVAATPHASAAATAAAAAAAAAAAQAAAAAEEAAAAEAAALASAAPVIPAKAFSLENIRQITDYVTQGYFQHYRLYQAVFNRKVSSSPA